MMLLKVLSMTTSVRIAGDFWVLPKLVLRFVISGGGVWSIYSKLPMLLTAQ